MCKDIGLKFPYDLDINMYSLVELGILNHADAINERSSYSTGQKKLASNLEKYKEKYRNLKLEISFYKESDLYVLKDTIFVTEEIETLLTKIVSMQSSKFAKYLMKDIQNLWFNLTKAQELIDIWVKTQKFLTQQFQIFTFGDLKKQLSEEYPKYDFVEKQWRIILEVSY